MTTPSSAVIGTWIFPTSWHVSVAAESITAALFAQCGYDVSVKSRTYRRAMKPRWIWLFVLLTRTMSFQLPITARLKHFQFSGIRGGCIERVAFAKHLNCSIPDIGSNARSGSKLLDDLPVSFVHCFLV
jgi:hypothetical protein